MRTDTIVRFQMTFSRKFGGIIWINVRWLCTRWLRFLIAVMMLDVIHVTNMRQPFQILRGVTLNLRSYAIVRIQIRFFSCDCCLYAYHVFFVKFELLGDVFWQMDPFINNNFTLRYQYHYLSIRFQIFDIVVRTILKVKANKWISIISSEMPQIGLHCACLNFIYDNITCGGWRLPAAKFTQI